MTRTEELEARVAMLATVLRDLKVRHSTTGEPVPIVEQALAATSADVAAYEQRIRADERERCAKAADDDSVRLFDSRRKAVAAGRESVASHRQSDIETATRIAAAIRVLGDAPGEA